jgi:hypothetical protein
VTAKGTRAAGWGLIGLMTIGLISAWQSTAQNQAAVTVRFEDGHTESRCVAFDEASISGLDLLGRSGLEVRANIGAQGGLVCSVEGTGCPAEDCWCQCGGGGDCVYWSYWHLRGDEWQYAQVGAAQTTVRPGSVDGWSWGPGTVEAAVAPPVTSFAEICAGPDATQGEADASDADAAGGSAGQLMAFTSLLLVLLAAGVLVWRRRRTG